MQITAVVNLQTDDDMTQRRLDWKRLAEHYRKREITVFRHPIRDFDPDDLRRRIRAAADRVGELEAVGHQIYIHCTAGVCRAPAVAIGHLTWNLGWSLAFAYDFVRKRRKCDPYLESIQKAE